MSISSVSLCAEYIFYQSGLVHFICSPVMLLLSIFQFYVQCVYSTLCNCIDLKGENVNEELKINILCVYNYINYENYL